MCEEVARRARNARKVGRTISLGLGYSKDEFGGGFLRTRTIEEPTNVTMDIYRVCLELIEEHYRGQTVRSISIAISSLFDDYEMQLSLFDAGKWKKQKIGYVVDQIRKRYGSASLLRAVSFTDGGTALQRSTLLGGHKK